MLSSIQRACNNCRYNPNKLLFPSAYQAIKSQINLRRSSTFSFGASANRQLFNLNRRAEYQHATQREQLSGIARTPLFHLSSKAGFSSDQKSDKANANDQSQPPNELPPKIIIDRTLLESIPRERIRNFSIIAHIDHGKSTLADRMLEMTSTVLKLDKSSAQVLDTLQVERERGITVLAQTATMVYTYPKDGKQYLLNLIDTPGHVDFSYQVSRSIRACEGAVLVVDATKGIQAQTLSNFFHAFDASLNIIPVINKIELPAADIPETEEQLVDELDFPLEDLLYISAKDGTGVEKVFESIIERVEPPPLPEVDELTVIDEKSKDGDPLKCFLFDARFVPERGGVACLIKVMSGVLNHDNVKQLMSFHRRKRYEIYQVGVVQPDLVPTGLLTQGQVGYFLSNMKSVSDAQVGDTFFREGAKVTAFPGYKAPQAVVFAGIYPEDPDDYEDLEKSLTKLCLTDGSVEMMYESSAALGSGFRCGFLGMLHMDVFRQRLKDEHSISAIVTQPSVSYLVRTVNAKAEKRDMPEGAEALLQGVDPNSEEALMKRVDTPMDAPRTELISYWKEALVSATIITPREFAREIKRLCESRRGYCKSEEFMSNGKVVNLQYELPLSELITDFFDQMKSQSQGYASLDYEHSHYEKADIKKITFFLNGDPVDALTFLVHDSRTLHFAKGYAKKLKDILPPQLFKIAIQAKIGGKIIAREDIKALRKDVTAKLYGGDVTRRMKLINKQKKGKKAMRMMGTIPVTSDTFLKLLKTN